MTQSEFMAWKEFYTEEPFDDHHRYHRPAVLVATSMAPRKFQDCMDFLVPPVVGPVGEFSAADMTTFATFGVKPPRK